MTISNVQCAIMIIPFALLDVKPLRHGLRRATSPFRAGSVAEVPLDGGGKGGIMLAISLVFLLKRTGFGNETNQIENYFPLTNTLL